MIRTDFRGALGFIKHEVMGGVLLLCAALLALVLVNYGAAEVYNNFLHSKIGFTVGPIGLYKSALHWINDGLMAVFFLLVGLEVKRELLVGELSSVRRALLPFFAAVGGMAVPALIYYWINIDNPELLRGWAIPAATDIAFAVAILAIVGSRVPASLKIFLLAVAIIDDLGAIVVIALFFTADLSVMALALAGAGVVALIILNLSGVKRTWPYILVGIFVWACVLKSGVHATLAGVITGLAIPLSGVDGQSENGPLVTLEHALHSWIKYLVLPLFAFANAGVSLAGFTPLSLTDSLSLGIIAGLVVGKPLGIFLASWLAVGAGLCQRPEGTNWMQILGVGCLAGIGFTMSLFIGMLAFPDAASAAIIRISVLVASIASAVLGLLLLASSSARSQPVVQPAN